MESASQDNQVSTANLPLVNIYIVSYPARFLKMAIAIQKIISETESTYLVQWRQNHMLWSHDQLTSTLSMKVAAIKVAWCFNEATFVHWLTKRLREFDGASFFATSRVRHNYFYHDRNSIAQ